MLLNGDILEQVKEASENDYFGSADRELEKYLDSVEGKMQKLQNHLQELASITIDSEWLKGLITLGDGAVQIIAKLTETVGGLNIAIGAIMGTIATAKGIGKIGFTRNLKCRFI